MLVYRRVNIIENQSLGCTGSDPDLLDLGSHSGPSAHPEQNCNMDLGQNKNWWFTMIYLGPWEEEGKKKNVKHINNIKIYQNLRFEF